VIKKVLSVENVTISFSTGFFLRKKQIVNNISFSAFEGQRIALVGSNGSGKTTLLKSIVGLIPAYSGTIIKDTHKIGYLPERYSGPSFLSAYQFMYYMGKLCDISSQKLYTKIDNLFTLFNMTDYAGEKIGNLSKGTAQRLYIAQAMINDPLLLILDEPYSGLDTTSTDQLNYFLDQLSQHGTAIISSMHTVGTQTYDQVIAL